MKLGLKRAGWLGVVALGALGAQKEERIPGFTRAGSRAQRELEAKLRSIPSPEMAERHLRFFTGEPHLAGSDRDREMAEYIRGQWKEYGLEEVRLLEYRVLLPYPEEVSVRLMEPYESELNLREEGYPEDQDSYASSVGLPYNAYSASGQADAQVVYVNSGNPEDYQQLEELGIDVRGKIALVRYSVPYSYRGFKALTAQQRSVAALLIYSDPADDGYGKGETYPRGPWGPESHIQRGGIPYDFLVPGDPLTPGWASVEGARRIPASEASSLPKILCAPLSYREARKILENLSGPVVPEGWQGGLPFTYHVGPGPARVRIRLRMDDQIRPIWVVEGRIRGSEEPDQWVIVGNHRDAWIYGAVDPSSGTASLMELARALGSLLRQGHRPRRTLILASWDAEEFTLTGSTEWGEQFADEVRAKAVAYLNVDSSTSGPNFEASAVPSLNDLIESVTREVPDPGTGRPLHQVWSKRTAGEGKAAPVENRLGSGSDYTVFLNFLGIPIADLSFEGPYGVYHSIYDSFHWMSRFGDPGFRYHSTLSVLWGMMALRVANASVLPLNFEAYARQVTVYLREVEKEAARKVDLRASLAQASRWLEASRALNRRVRAALDRDALPAPDRLRQLNQALAAVEQRLLDEKGIPGRPWYRHLIYAPRYTYAAEVLPGITEAVEKRDWEQAQEETLRVEEALRRAVEQVETASSFFAAQARRKQRLSLRER